MSPDSRRKVKIARDTFIVFVALALSVYEVVWGGARPSVLVFLGSLLTAPLALRADESRRASKEQKNDTG